MGGFVRKVSTTYWSSEVCGIEMIQLLTYRALKVIQVHLTIPPNTNGNSMTPSYIEHINRFLIDIL